jgi:hypothetical protein
MRTRKGEDVTVPDWNSVTPAEPVPGQSKPYRVSFTLVKEQPGVSPGNPSCRVQGGPILV